MVLFGVKLSDIELSSKAVSHGFALNCLNMRGALLMARASAAAAAVSAVPGFW